MARNADVHWAPMAIANMDAVIFIISVIYVELNEAAEYMNNAHCDSVSDSSEGLFCLEL